MGSAKTSIVSLKKEISRLKKLVHHDELTRLYNRLGFAEKINDYLNELKGEHKKGNKNKRSFKIGNLSIVFADLNNLKKFNDEYGHVCGDEAIKAFAKLLKKGVRGIDIVCRWSGDEFVVALVGADKKDAQKIVEKINKMAAEKSWKIRGASNRVERDNQVRLGAPAAFDRGGGGNFKISAGFGIASVIDETRKPKQVFELKSLVYEADKKMYEDKKRQKSLI